MPEKRVIPPRIRSGLRYFRDSSLIVIATEGRKTEKKYFEDLAKAQESKQKQLRVKVKVLEKPDDRSNPESVLKQMDQFTQEFSFEGDDTLWLVGDRDHWTLKEMTDVAQKCAQKGYKLAISNPAFEIWLLLHIKDLQEYSASERKDLLLNKKDNTTRTRLEREIIAIAGRYCKEKLRTEDFLPHVEIAIVCARNMDQSPRSRWPNSLGTRVYLLVEKILDKG